LCILQTGKILIHLIDNYRAEQKGRNYTEEDPKRYLNLKPEEELQRQFDEIQFNTSMCCFSLIRFIADHMQDLSIPIVH